MSDQAVTDFRYLNLNEVDPNFELLDPEVYTLRIAKAEFRTYLAKTANPAKGVNVGDEGAYINFTFRVMDHPKFSGRPHYESLFSSNFNAKVLRRIADATGIPQSGTMQDWLTELSATGPAIKVKVDKVDDVVTKKNPQTGEYETFPNPKTVNPDGTPKQKNAIDWKAGVQPGA